MKVLFIHCYYQCSGGEDGVVEDEIKLLRSKGFEVELLAFSNAKNVMATILQMPFNFATYRITSKKLLTFRPDVVHIHNFHFAASASVLYAIKRRQIPFVVTLHNYRLLCPSATFFHKGKPFTNSLKEYFPWTAIRNGVYRNSKLLTFWLSLSMKIHTIAGTWKLCSRYIVLSQQAKDIFISAGIGIKAAQIVVKPNFTFPVVHAASARGSHFLYVGRLSTEKGIIGLIKAFSAMPYKLKIAGDGPLKNEVIQLIKNSPNITYTGPLQKSEVLTELQTCSALVFPSVWHEGMPLTVIEAFCCGTPVIASRIGIMETMIKHGVNGLHFEAGNQSELQDKIEQWVLLGDEKKQQMRQNALLTYRQHYTPERNAQLLTGIYSATQHLKPYEFYYNQLG